MQLAKAKYRMIKNGAIDSYVYLTYIEFRTCPCTEYKATLLFEPLNNKKNPLRCVKIF